MEQRELTKNYLKWKLQKNPDNYRGCMDARKTLYDLLERSIKLCELNSALLIGSRGSGKTTLVSSVLREILLKYQTQSKNIITVYLNGLLHTDDRLALYTIAKQLSLENIIDEKNPSGTFAKNLSSLLQCLKGNHDDNNDNSLPLQNKKKCIIFILEEFDLFCKHQNQILLYSLFDVIQSQPQLTICVLGITCRYNVIELLEKRVKSRFSHRQIFLYSDNDNFSNYIELFKNFLKLQLKSNNIDDNKNLVFKMGKLQIIENSLNYLENCKFSLNYINIWNKCIDNLVQHSSIQKILQNLYNFDTRQSLLKMFVFKILSKFNNEFIKVDDIIKVYENEIECDEKITLLKQLSILEICILIAIKHYSKIYNTEQFNFEIIYQRLNKFFKTTTMLQNIDKNVIYKAFGRLQDIEFIVPVSSSSSTGNFSCSNQKNQKQFCMFKMLLTDSQIDNVLKSGSFPTEIIQWAQNSIL